MANKNTKHNRREALKKFKRTGDPATVNGVTVGKFVPFAPDRRKKVYPTFK